MPILKNIDLFLWKELNYAVKELEKRITGF